GGLIPPKERSMPGTLWRWYGVSLVLALALLRCTGGEADLTGTWTGTLIDSIAGTGTLRLTITQNTSQLTGTWQSTFADATNNGGGSLAGGVSEASTPLGLSAAQPQAGSLTGAGTPDSTDERPLTRPYVTFKFARTRKGALDVRR